MKTILLITITFLGLIYISPSKAQEGNTFFDLAKINTDRQSKRVSSFDKTGGNGDNFSNIQDGEKRVLFDVKGAGIIDHIWITIAPPPPELSRNDIILRMYWDGNEFPSVASPIGPFFGQGWDESYNFVSMPLAAGPRQGRALVSYFAMPFSKGARIEIENQTGRKIDAFYFYIDYVEMEQLPEEMGRFCAWYNHELTEALPEGENEWGTLGPLGKNTTGKDNYLILDVKGKGHYVGVNYYVHCPSPMWYGEGDDMFFIDGQEWPATLNGTGTEDYFNSSWSPNEPYNHPFFGTARIAEGYGWLGRTHVYRFHITDPVYFDKSLTFSIEHGHNNNLTLDLATVAYWYQKPPLQKLAPMPSKEERKVKPFIQAYDIHLWRHEWRKNHGNDSKLWGNERDQE